MALQQWFNTWGSMLMYPSSETFGRERNRPQATLQTALIWIEILGALQALLLLLMASASGGMTFPTVAMVALVAVVLPLLFLLFMWLVQALAEALGGHGQFDKYAYLVAATWVPLQLAYQVLQFVPFGALLGLLPTVYLIWLGYRITRVEHGLSSGRAAVVALLPVVIVTLLVFGFMLLR